MKPSLLRLLAASVVFAASAPAALAGEPATPDAKGVVFEPGSPPIADVLAKAAAAGKPAFLDFFTEH